MKKAYLYSQEYSKFDYGPTHPLKMVRLELSHRLIQAYDLLKLPGVEVVEVAKATKEDLLAFHGRKYLEALSAANSGIYQLDSYMYGLGDGDNPVFAGLLDWSCLITGASLQCANMICQEEADIAVNLAGGLHHALEDRASGFCYVNDPVIAIKYLLGRGKRVVYIDIDAHHGDGVQKAFYDSNEVLTISLHQDGTTLFPGTGFCHEIGEGVGRGYSVNLPLYPGSDDEIFIGTFEEIVPPIVKAFNPDIIVAQLGVDTFKTDPLTSLQLTTSGFLKVVKHIKGLCPKLLALGGGGYHILNVARAWTLLWGELNGVTLPSELPVEFNKIIDSFGFKERRLYDSPFVQGGDIKKKAILHAEKNIAYIKKHVFPLLHKEFSKR